jgi:hypothetical protein
VYDVRTGRQVSATPPAGKRVRWVLLSPDGRRLVTEPDDYTFRLHDSATGAQLADFGRGALSGAEFTADSTRLITWTGGDVTDGVAAHDVVDGRFLWGRATYPGNNWSKFQEVFIPADGAHVVCRRRYSPHDAVRIADGQEVPITTYYPQSTEVPVARLVQPGVRGGPQPTDVGGPGRIALHKVRVASPDGRQYSELGHGKGYIRADMFEATGRSLGHAILPELPLDSRLLDDGSLLVVGYHQIQLYRPRRPAPWWGCAWLPAFWAVIITGAAFVMLKTRDLRRWYRPPMPSVV